MPGNPDIALKLLGIKGSDATVMKQLIIDYDNVKHPVTKALLLAKMEAVSKQIHLKEALSQLGIE
jgi:hypothetical protein